MLHEDEDEDEAWQKYEHVRYTRMLKLVMPLLHSADQVIRMVTKRNCQTALALFTSAFYTNLALKWRVHVSARFSLSLLFVAGPRHS